MNKFFKYILPAAVLMLASSSLVSCTGDLDVTPLDPSLQTVDSIQPEQLFNKCYACLAVAGNGGANGDSDVDGIDGGTSGYFRQVWNANELTTDEAICSWGDDGIPQFNYDTYDAGHPMLQGLYYRLYTTIVFCNDYIDKFADYNATMTAEVRFLRALTYYYLLDGWGNVNMVTSASDAGHQVAREELFQYVEQELLEVEPLLDAPEARSKASAKWGRVDKDAARLLLARLYLNAQVYTGEARWADAANYAKQVMDGPHKLNTQGVDCTVDGLSHYFTPYQMLFMGDNDVTSASSEAILPLLQDGLRTTSWGTALFLIASTWDADMHENPFDETATNGTSEAWGGNRARPDLVRLFFPRNDAPSSSKGYNTAVAAGDDRALFNTDGRTLEVETPTTFKSGYAVAKFTNFKTDNSIGSHSQFPDADVFFMRTAEAYLTYAEALTRQNGGNAPAEAVNAINAVRERANASTRNVYTLDEILDEWGREFYFEGRRRIDLVRFGQFGGPQATYTWAWKGGVAEGRNFPATRNIFAIPTNDLIANPSLVQNPGY